jgi:hypothetical protein
LTQGVVILRNTIGIEQRWLVNSAGAAVLDREEMPGEGTPFTTFPSVGVGTGWNVGDRFVYRDDTQNPSVYKRYRVGTVGPLQIGILESISSAGSGGATNLTTTASPTSVVVNSDTGTDATIPLATATNAGLLLPGLIDGPGATLPATAARVGQLYWLDGVGLHSALDLVGNWQRV